ncbi:hypothetical protein [Vagococcus acidifermentans]|uniref:Niacin transporter NiaX n=1 Tax=Vagococcus acidifermentans TaxID=564710 RepID=A0A430AUM6_9ENTE|nr:hypothetical protein [Vagococcus acidifermentans]RSU11760.1 hypothetical protein CBF27_07315 [Vagococcus acidifermentans]
MQKKSVNSLTYSALLIALGILIPMVMPVKVAIGPASFTLASHVPVFLAMFVSPGVAAVVALGTAFGFLLSMPIVIAMRALSHLVFALIGAFILAKRPMIVESPLRFQLFNLFIGIIHTICEVAVVTAFFMQDQLDAATYTSGFFYSVILLVGVGGLIHSIVDYNIAYAIGKKFGMKFNFPIFREAHQAGLKK